MPERIEALERERDALYQSVADPAFARDGEKMADAKSRLAAIAAELAAAETRWEDLESRNY